MVTVLTILDVLGTFVFALSGAVTGVRNRLDLFGVLVLSFAAANTGGIIRDVMIGAIPPAAISDPKTIAVSILAGGVTFLRFPAVTRFHGTVQLLDAAGLALFSVSGALKALQFGVGPAGAILMGVLTGIGGGMARDLLVAQTPVVLRAELYAVAALVGAGVVVVGQSLQLATVPTAITGAGLCLVIRVLAIRRGWRLPVASAS